MTTILSDRRARSGRNKMATHVNLDALIEREDFDVVSVGINTDAPAAIKLSDLENDAFFFGALRKPDFQRETSEWNPDRVVGLIRTFIEGDLIPGVILWQHKELLFVIDGSHRLGALIAWVQNDFGDGKRSKDFFDSQIPDEQISVAERTRKLVEKEFDSYERHKKAIASPDDFGPDIVKRARRFGSLSLNLQWVRGDASKAENSFLRINQQAAMIKPQEIELIKSRRKPTAIAARAIARRGTGHQYWSSFDQKMQDRIKDLATEIYRMIFEPKLQYPLKSADLPAGGSAYASTALRMIYDFITMSVGVPSKDDDTQGDRTVDYLQRCRRVMQLLLSNHPSSLGLHPAVYFYSWTGNQQPILFLTIAGVMVDFERMKKLPSFIELRGRFEDFLVINRSLVNQIVRRFGTKDSGTKHLRRFYDDIMGLITEGVEADNMVSVLQADPRYKYLQPAESPYESGTAPAKFSTHVRSGLVLRERLPNAPRCELCHGYIPTQSISVDHIVPREEGGLATVENARLTHPYCNTGYRERQRSNAK